MGLIGRFIGAEARVAIDPVHRFLRIRNVVGSEFRELRVDRLHHAEHRRSHDSVEQFFARLEPFAAVVARQVAQKFERLRAGTFRSSFIID